MLWAATEVEHRTSAGFLPPTQDARAPLDLAPPLLELAAGSRAAVRSPCATTAANHRGVEVRYRRQMERLEHDESDHHEALPPL
jgi:hypothetical protein